MLAPGTILQERYQIIGIRGRGGMGSVYRAHDQNLGIRVAIKERTPDPNASPEALAAARDQFRREAKVLAGLTHPNLPRVTDYFSSGGNEYLVMDLIEGEDLATIAARGAIPETTVLAWAAQLLDALSYIHARQIVHRDIKPQNVILTPDQRVVLVDFGLVKLWDPNDPRTLTSLRGMGTPEYAPLEQYAATGGHTDPRSDLYSFGAMLYHLLTGRAPLEVHSRVLAPALQPMPRVLNAAISAQVEWALLKGMEIYPENRFSSAAEMKSALLSPQTYTPVGTQVMQGITSSVGVTGPYVGEAATQKRGADRKQILLVAGIGALIFAAVVLIAILPRFFPSPSAPTTVPVVSSVVIAPTSISTSTPRLSPTSPPPPTAMPYIPPTATRTAPPPPTNTATRIPPTTTAALPSGVYVTNIRTLPPNPRNVDAMRFRVTFFNNAGPLKFKWCVLIYQGNRQIGDTSCEATIEFPLGTYEYDSTKEWRFGTGQPCTDFTAKVQGTEMDGKKLFFKTQNLTENGYNFTLCP